MARIAVISDIHGNLVALERVVADIRQRRIDLAVCLGDIVGYGPDAKACLDITRQLCQVVIAGNHERGVVQPALSMEWSPLAIAGIDHARAQLGADDLAALEALPMSFILGGQVFGTHDSPEPSPDGLTYLRTRADAARAFQCTEHPITLVGHTHVPACFSTAADFGTIVANKDVAAAPVARRLLGPAQELRGAFVAGASFELPRFGRSIVNPGSVGQPRDGDARASYAILDLDEYAVEFRRVAYDLERARDRVRTAKLPDASAARLALGA